MSTKPAGCNEAAPGTASSCSAPGPAALTILDPRELLFIQNGAALHLTLKEDCTHLRVGIFRAFPLTRPQHWYSVRAQDGKEIGLIPDPAALSVANRLLVEAHLQRRYVVILILRVLRAEKRFGTVDWEVETDRGACRFTTRDLRDTLQSPEPGCYLLTDVDGNRYRIADLAALDPRSQALLFRFV